MDVDCNVRQIMQFRYYVEVAEVPRAVFKRLCYPKGSKVGLFLGTIL